MVVVLLCSGLCCAQVTLSPPAYDSSPCSGGNDARTQSFRLSRMLAPPTDYVLISELGIEPTIRIFCIRLIESPDTGSCATRSLPRLCKDFINVEGKCESLAEYRYTPNREIVRGEANGPDVKWILLWDPMNKPANCYPRDVTIEVEYILEKPQGRSAVLAVIAIVGVSVLVIAIGAFGLSRLLSKTKRQREAKKAAEQGTKEERQSHYNEAYDTAICPKCGHGQAKHWAGEDPLIEMRCRECGRTLAGWMTADTLLRQQQSAAYSATPMPEGYSSMEIGARHDTAKRDAVIVSKYAPNPLVDTFPPATGSNGSRDQKYQDPIVVGQVVQRRGGAGGGMTSPELGGSAYRSPSKFASPVPFHNEEEPVFEQRERDFEQ